MRKEIVYSFLALGGAIPVTVSAADVQTIEVLASATGEEVTHSVGKLVPGNYTFSAELTSKVYGVKVSIGEQEETYVAKTEGTTTVSIDFTVEEETEISLSLVSVQPNASGAKFSVAEAKVILQDFGFNGIKADLEAKATALVSTIDGYTNEDYKATDKEQAEALVTKIQGLTETYENYVEFQLYAEKSTIETEIEELAETAKGHEDAYLNDEAYKRVSKAIQTFKTKYNNATKGLAEELKGAAEYLSADANNKLEEQINSKITKAIKDLATAKKAGKAVEFENSYTAEFPTEEELDDLITEWKDAATENKDAYEGLVAQLNELKEELKKVPANKDGDKTTDYNAAKNAANDAITVVENKIGGPNKEGGLYNTAGQLTAGVIDTEVANANTKINDFSTLAKKINSVYDAYQAAHNAIEAQRTALKAAQEVVAEKTAE